jgi:hypothetical protein
VYQSEARLLVGRIDSDFNEVRAAGQQTQTFAQLATSGAVLQATAHRLGPPATADGLAPDVRAQADDVARLITLTVRASRPDAATSANGALVTELQAFAQRGGKTKHDLSVVDPPSVGLAIGSGRTPLVALAVAAASWPASASSSWPTWSAAARRPVLGKLRRRDRSTGRAFQALAARIQFAEGRAPRCTVLVETLEAQERSGLIALELGRALARDGGRVILVDAASGRGTLTWRLGIEGNAGTNDLLRAGGDALAVHDLLVDDEPRLAILPSGLGPDPASFEAGSPRQMLRRLAGRADVVLVSGPSPATSPNGLRWAQATDATILVATRWQEPPRGHRPGGRRASAGRSRHAGCGARRAQPARPPAAPPAPGGDTSPCARGACRPRGERASRMRAARAGARLAPGQGGRRPAPGRRAPRAARAAATSDAHRDP